MLFRNDSQPGSPATFTPVWSSWETDTGSAGFSAVSCAFGDADHDGDLDLALAVYARGYTPPLTFEPAGGVTIYPNVACAAKQGPCKQGPRGFYDPAWSSATPR